LHFHKKLTISVFFSNLNGHHPMKAYIISKIL